jgi:calcium/proton exchanger cax
MNIAKSGLLIGAIATTILVFIPLSCVAKYQHWGDLSVFATSALAIIPLSIVLSTATEKIAMVTGPSIGGLVDASRQADFASPAAISIAMS